MWCYHIRKHFFFLLYIVPIQQPSSLIVQIQWICIFFFFHIASIYIYLVGLLADMSPSYQSGISPRHTYVPKIASSTQFYGNTESHQYEPDESEGNYISIMSILLLIVYIIILHFMYSFVQYGDIISCFVTSKIVAIGGPLRKNVKYADGG